MILENCEFGSSLACWKVLLSSPANSGLLSHSLEALFACTAQVFIVFALSKGQSFAVEARRRLLWIPICGVEVGCDGTCCVLCVPSAGGWGCVGGVVDFTPRPLITFNMRSMSTSNDANKSGQPLLAPSCSYCTLIDSTAGRTVIENFFSAAVVIGDSLRPFSRYSAADLICWMIFEKSELRSASILAKEAASMPPSSRVRSQP